jgi:cytochrome c peroxidase
VKRRLLVLICVTGCTDYLTPNPRETLSALPDSVPTPADNPARPETIELGRLLYWDPILSGDRDIACATCHHPDFAYSDGLAVSVGTGGRGVGPLREQDPDAPRTPRNSQTVLATAWNGLSVDGPVTAEAAPMFWDHRVTSLESQVLGPLKSAAEMRGTTFGEDEILDEVVRRVAGIPEYVAQFQAAFDEGVSTTTVAKAIAAFERTLVPKDSSFDRYMAGDDDAMTPAQVRGMHGFIFQGCARCHSGPLFSDFQLHEIAIPSLPDAPVDLGDGTGRFRTPSLRMVTLTAPYMHNGALATLGPVFDNYHNNILTDPLLDGDVEVALGGADDLILFFEALSDGTFDRTIPERVPSGLPPGGP